MKNHKKESFEQFFNATKNKFTIILGSGFHRHFINKDSILSSWEMLLQKLGSGSTLTGEYHLDFENIVVQEKSHDLDSRISERQLIQRIQDSLKEDQKNILVECADCYPLWLFNPEYISDIISLNFDEIPEKLLGKQNGIKLGAFINDSSFNSKSINSYDYLSTRHRTIYFENGQQIQFWHPHGLIENNNSIVLGLNRYAHMVESVIRIRKNHMQHKRSDREDNTWYFRLIQNPVIILGAGMSQSEWDIWFALTSRNRTNGEKHPIFQMRECECKIDAQHHWFEPLFTGMNFDQQWKELEKLFNQ